MLRQHIVTTPRLRRGAALVAFALLALSIGGLASAPGVAAQEQETINSWALTPTGTDPSQPGSRSNLSYSLAPGATLDDSVTLWNYGNVPLTFDVYATDAINNREGGFTLRAAGEASTDAGVWVKVGIGNITLPAETSVTIPVTVSVPADATPGDHTAGIVASSKTPANDGSGNQVLLDRRVGTRVYVRVAGPVNPQLEVTSVDTTYHGGLNPLDGTVDVEYRVRNTGNVRLGARQLVEVNDLFGTAASKRLPPIRELLPGNTAVVRASFTGVAATLRVSADVEIAPIAASNGTDVEPPAAFSRSASAWAIPWLLLLVVAVLVLAGWWYARRRRRRQASSAPGVRRGPGSTAPSSNGHGQVATPRVGAR